MSDPRAEPGGAEPITLSEDNRLVGHLSLLGKALGSPLRVRLAAALLQVSEGSPASLARLLGAELSNVAYHVRYLRDLGFIEETRQVPVRGAIEHFYAIMHSLRRALPAASQALEGAAAESEPAECRELAAQDPELLSFSWFFIHSKGAGAGPLITDHAATLAEVGKGLASEDRIIILGYLLTQEYGATTTELARRLGLSRAAVGHHVRQMADVYMIRPEGRPDFRGHWVVTPPMKNALGGLYDLLTVVRKLRDAATPSLDARQDAEREPSARAGHDTKAGSAES